MVSFPPRRASRRETTARCSTSSRATAVIAVTQFSGGFGSGQRFSTNYGGDLRNTGAAFSGRLRPDGTIVPRNSLFAPAQNRTDLRVQQRIPLGGRVSVDGIAEVFNMFNRPNYGIGTQESSQNYRMNTSAQTRTMQFGFRFQF